MALETLFETPPPLVSSENKESLNEGSERDLEEEGEILEDGELSDEGGDGAQQPEQMEEEEGYGDGGYQEEEIEVHEQVIESPRKSRRRHRHREVEEEEEEGNEEDEDDRERRRRRKRRKEKHSSRRHHHKKSKRRKRHHSSGEENGSPEDAEERSVPPRKRRSVHKDRRHPSEPDEAEVWEDDGEDLDEGMRMERERGGRGRREKRSMGRGGEMWGMRGMGDEEEDERGYASSGADSWEEEMRKYKAHQEGFIDEESEEEMHVPMGGPPRGRGRGRGRGKPPPGAKPSFIQEKLKKIALAAKMKGKGRGRPPGPKPPKEPRGEQKMMLHLICKFYLEGRCKKGENCTYSHDLTQQRKQELCKFYVSGFCNKGDTCLYMHDHGDHSPENSEDEIEDGSNDWRRGEMMDKGEKGVVGESDMDLASDLDQEPWPEPGLPDWVPVKEDLEIEKRLWCWMTPDQLAYRPDLVQELESPIGSWFRANSANMYSDALDFAEYWVRYEMTKLEAKKDGEDESLESGLGRWVPVQESTSDTEDLDTDPNPIDPDRPGPGYHFYTTPGPDDTKLRWAYLPKSALLHAPDVPSLTPNLREFPCKYFHSGSECFQGDKCRFSHEPLTAHTKMLLDKSLSSFDDYDQQARSPSKTKGLLPTPGDTSHIPSLLDIEVEPPPDSNNRPMSFYGAENPDYNQPQHHGPPRQDYQDEFQDQQRPEPGPYQNQYQQDQDRDRDQYQDSYEMVNQFVSLARSTHDQAQKQEASQQRQEDQQEMEFNRGAETTPLPSSQSEDNSANSDKEISSSDFNPQERKTLLPSPPTDTSTKSPTRDDMEQQSSQPKDSSPATPSSASRPVQGELSPEPSPPREPPAAQKPDTQPSIPASIPAKQKALFMRIQQKQHDGQTGTDVNSGSEDNAKHKQSQDEASWYSSDEDESSKKPSTSQKKDKPMETSQNSAQEPPGPGLAANPSLSSDAVKKLTSIQIPSALANLFAGKTTTTSPSSTGNQVTFNLLDFVKKGPSSKPAALTPTSPQTEILDSPMSPINEEFRLIECIHEPGRTDPRAGKERRDKSDMRFRVLHWKENKYSINDPDDRPSLQPIELTTPTELKSQPSFPKTTFPHFTPGNQMQQPSMTVPPSQVPMDPRMNRDPRLSRMQGGQGGPDDGINMGVKDPRMSRDPRAMPPNMPSMPDMSGNSMPPPPLLPTPDERMRLMGPRPQEGLLPLPQGGPRQPLGPVPGPPFMQGPGPMGMGPPFRGPRPPMGRFPQDMPPPDMNMPPRGPPLQGPGPRMGPGPAQRPPFNRPPMMNQMQEGPANALGPPNFPGGPVQGDQSMNRFRGPAPNDPRSVPNDPRLAPKDPRNLNPRQAPQDPRDPRQAPQESRDPRLAQTESRDPRKAPPAESRDPRLMRQLSSNKPGGRSPSQPDSLPPQDIDERLNIPKLQDVDLRRQVPDRKAALQGFSIPKLQKRSDVAEADTTTSDTDTLHFHTGISHRKVPSAHHSQPQGLASFDVGGKSRTNIPSGDPRTKSGRDSPQITLQIQIPGNGEGDGDMAAAIAQLAEEPDIQLKDMFKTQDPTASPFC